MPTVQALSVADPLRIADSAGGNSGGGSIAIHKSSPQASGGTGSGYAGPSSLSSAILPIAFAEAAITQWLREDFHGRVSSASQAHILEQGVATAGFDGSDEAQGVCGLESALRTDQQDTIMTRWGQGNEADVGQGEARIEDGEGLLGGLLDRKYPTLDMSRPFDNESIVSENRSV